MKLNVLDTKGEKKTSLDLDVSVFDGKIIEPLMHQAVVTYLANQRKGLAAAKTRGQVRGGGKKPWRQKGTGRARFGSSRNPVWRGGGVAFGPVPHSFNKNFPKKMKNLALKSALNAKLKDNEIVILHDLEVKTNKTKEFMAIIKALKLESVKLRFVVDTLDKKLKLSTRNIEKVYMVNANELCTYEALDCRHLIFTKKALDAVVGRIKKCL